WAGAGALIGLAGLLSRWVCWHLARDPGLRPLLLRRYGSWRLYHQLGLVAFFSLAVYAGGWGWAVQQFCLGPRPVLVGGELLLLAPFLTALILSWAWFYDAERAFHLALAPDPEHFP